MISFDVTGKVYVITGGTGIICGEMARKLAAMGARVAILGRSLDKATALEKEIQSWGGEALGISCNVLDKASLVAAKDAILEKWGRVDCLINGAGGNHPQASTNADTSFFDLPEEGLRYVFDLNCLGVVLASQVFGSVMAEQGAGNIINIGSMAGIRPLTRVVAYGAAKAALTNLTQWMATYFATEVHPNIRVNGIAPGFLLTEQNRFLMVDKETGEPTARGAHVLQQTPMGRSGQPEEMVGAVVFLSSEAASFVTGVMLPIDGGFASYAI